MWSERTHNKVGIYTQYVFNWKFNLIKWCECHIVLNAHSMLLVCIHLYLIKIYETISIHIPIGNDKVFFLPSFSSFCLLQRSIEKKQNLTMRCFHLFFQLKNHFFPLFVESTQKVFFVKCCEIKETLNLVSDCICWLKLFKHFCACFFVSGVHI